MEFQAGAGVYAADGEHVADLDRLVIDPKTRQVTYLIIRRGLLFKTDRVLPVKLVASAEGERIMLRPEAVDLQDLPDFDEKHYVVADERDWLANPDRAATAEPTARVSGQAPAVFWYPTALGYPGYMPVPDLAQPPVVEETETKVEETRNIPLETVALKEGAKVIAADGVHVGKVVRVFTESKTSTVTHFLVSQGLLRKAQKAIPMDWVLDVGEDEVRLAIGSNLLEGLREYEG